MKNEFLKKLSHPLFLAGETCLLVGITLFAVFPFSCKVTTSGIEIISAVYTVPALENFTVESEKEITLEFSEEVNLLAAVVSPFVKGISDSGEHSVTEELSPALRSAASMEDSIPVSLLYSDDKKTVTVCFEKETCIGKMYKLYGEVENKKGSSLTFAVSFTGYNSRVPALLLTEIHDGKVSATSYGTFGVKEYVEFIALEDGNLAGLVLKTGSGGDDSIFMMPALEVKKGDFITVHYGFTEDENALCISETAGDKKASKAKGSSDSSWDLWLDVPSSVIGGTQDIIYLENCYTGQMLQALSYTKKDKTSWSNKNVTAVLDKAVIEGIWEPGQEIGDAFIFTKSTLYGIERVNTNEIVSLYESGNLDYPFPSNKNEWKEIANKELSPGY